MVPKAKGGLKAEQRRKLRQLRESLVAEGMPSDLIRRKLRWYRKMIGAASS